MPAVGVGVPSSGALVVARRFTSIALFLHAQPVGTQGGPASPPSALSSSQLTGSPSLVELRCDAVGLCLGNPSLDGTFCPSNPSPELGLFASARFHGSFSETGIVGGLFHSTTSLGLVASNSAKKFSRFARVVVASRLMPLVVAGMSPCMLQVVCSSSSLL